MPHEVQRIFLSEVMNDASEDAERIAYNGAQNNAGHTEIFCEDDRTEDVSQAKDQYDLTLNIAQVLKEQHFRYHKIFAPLPKMKTEVVLIDRDLFFMLAF